MIVDMREAKSQLSRLVERAAAGEEVIIGKAGRPVARLVPYERGRQRRPGRWQGHVALALDFDQAPTDVIAAFEGR